MNKSRCKNNHYYYSYNIRLGKLIWKVIISRLPAASLLTSGGTRRQRLHEFPKWSPGLCDSPAFVLPKFGLNYSQIKAAILQNQPLPVGLPRILHICLCILLDYIVKKILNRISSRPGDFFEGRSCYCQRIPYCLLRVEVHFKTAYSFIPPLKAISCLKCLSCAFHHICFFIATSKPYHIDLKDYQGLFRLIIPNNSPTFVMPGNGRTY